MRDRGFAMCQRFTSALRKHGALIEYAQTGCNSAKARSTKQPWAPTWMVELAHRQAPEICYTDLAARAAFKLGGAKAVDHYVAEQLAERGLRATTTEAPK